MRDWGGAREVRSEDAFDVAAVHAWLREAVDVPDTPPDVRQFTGGASNLTYVLRYPEFDWILRRPPGGKKPKSGHDMPREYRVHRALGEAGAAVPEMVALCEDESVIGAPFYVMERVEGVIPRKSMPSALRGDAAQTRTVCDSALEQLVALHALDWRSAGIEDLYRGAGYVRRQVDGWSRRYRAAHTWNVPRWTGVMAWLDANCPPDAAPTLVHNDFRFDNLVFDPVDGRVVAVLDWELATIGDPRADLGSSLAYWVNADDDRLMQAVRRQPTHLPGMRTRREVVAYYAEQTGRDVSGMDFFVTLGLFRLAGIVQQIYYRYHNKQTRNPAFRWFWVINHYLHHRAKAAMRGGW